MQKANQQLELGMKVRTKIEMEKVIQGFCEGELAI